MGGEDEKRNKSDSELEEDSDMGRREDDESWVQTFMPYLSLGIADCGLGWELRPQDLVTYLYRRCTQDCNTTISSKHCCPNLAF